MKRVTASEARRNWFRILDEVAAGEVFVIDRKGHTIQVRREPEEDRTRAIPDYSTVLRARADVCDADLWGWTWAEEEEDLVPVEGDPA